MKLIYDIAVMAQLVAACETANNEINKAEQLIQQVHSHNDWTCKEKSVIDELMQDCKRLIQRMREDQSSFLRVMKEVEGELNDTENSVSNLFSGVESILSKVLGIPVATAVAVGGGLLGAVSAIGQTPFGNAVVQAWDQFTDKIDIQNQMMDQFNPDHVGTGWAGDFIEKLKDIGQDIMDTDVIWHGPPAIGNPSQIHDIIDGANISDTIVNGAGGIIGVAPTVIGQIPDIIAPIADIGEPIGSQIINGASVIKDGWTQARETNPNLPHNRENTIVGGIGIQEAWENVIDVAQPITEVIGNTVSGVAETAGGIWAQVQDSPIGDAVQDALKNMMESISICEMSDLKL